MPKYEYYCTKCKNIFDKWVSYKEDPHKAQCPKCKNKKVKKIISSFPVHYKGSGFYSTDKDS